MNVLVVADAQLFRTPDGKVGSQTIYSCDFWKRYLDVFETVTAASRMGEADYSQVEGFLRSDGNNVTFAPMPMVRGMKGYIKKLIRFVSSAKKAVLLFQWKRSFSKVGGIECLHLITQL